MDEFLLASNHGIAQLRFFDREPYDRAVPVERFLVQLNHNNLSCTASVYAGLAENPAGLFLEMARHWKGWPNALEWKSIEAEFCLSCRHDRLGHIDIDVRLESRLGGWPADWLVQTTLRTEAGQLDRLSIEAVRFFG